jgi:hypothetical protein
MSTYSTTILADSPIRYYRLDETSGTAATDSGSGAHNGTYTGGFTLNQSGLLIGDSDASALFNGTTGYVSIPTTSLPTGAGTWSVEAWVNFSSLANAPQVFFMGTNATNQAIELYYSSTNSRWQADLNGATTVNGAAATTNTTYYLAATYDGTQLRLYVNGSLAGGPTTVTANLAYGTALIGSFNASSEFCTGRIDEPAIYSTALSATRILAHYNAGINAGVHRIISDGYGGMFS